MEFIKVGKDKWLIKASNGRLVSDKEKRQLEKEEITIEDKKCEECEIKIPKVSGKIYKKKKIKPEAKITATSKKEIANDIIEETDIVI